MCFEIEYVLSILGFKIQFQHLYNACFISILFPRMLNLNPVTTPKQAWTFIGGGFLRVASGQGTDDSELTISCLQALSNCNNACNIVTLKVKRTVFEWMVLPILGFKIRFCLVFHTNLTPWNCSPFKGIMG